MLKTLWRFLMEAYADNLAGRMRLSKLFTTLLFASTIYIELYVVKNKDCAYALEFVLANLTFISVSLGLNVFSSIKTRQINLQAANCNGECNGNHDSKAHQ